jgi:hypothetical protein
MIEIKCPACDAGGRVPRDKKTTRLVCRKCLAVFHLSPSGKPVRGEPPAPKDVPKERVRSTESGGGLEFGGSIEDIAARFTKIKMPRVSGTTAGIAAAVILLAALGVWLLARQSLKTRSEMVANALMSQDAIKAVMDVTVPDTALDVIQWYNGAARRCGELKLAMGGVAPGVNIDVLSDGSNGPAVVRVQFSAEGTRLGNAGVETFQPTPSLSNTSSRLEEHLYFVKDAWGNWMLDGKRTLSDQP